MVLNNEQMLMTQPESRQLYDISRTIAPTLAVWPGDAPYTVTHQLRLADGESVNLTTLTLSAHTGSHADAPYHYTDDGAHPYELPLAPYIGPAHVVTIDRREGGIVPSDFDGHDLDGMQRLLIHTWVSALPDDAWPEDFPYPTVELMDWLSSREVRLLGLDSPSVDDFHSTDLPGHHRLHAHGMLNLEYLCLDGVPDGQYELIALPLKLSAACGSPVRAILRSLPEA